MVAKTIKMDETRNKKQKKKTVNHERVRVVCNNNKIWKIKASCFTNQFKTKICQTTHPKHPVNFKPLREAKIPPNKFVLNPANS